MNDYEYPRALLCHKIIDYDFTTTILRYTTKLQAFYYYALYGGSEVGSRCVCVPGYEPSAQNAALQTHKIASRSSRLQIGTFY